VPWQSILTVISFFMTATMPLIFSEENKEIYELVKDKRKYFEEFSRITIDAKRLTDKTTLDEYKTLLLDDILRYKKDDFSDSYEYN